jgi:hypothetical protein
MRLVQIALLACCLETPALMGQAANVVNSSRSNIKNNLTVSVGPDKKTRCTVSDKPCSKEDVDWLNTVLAGNVRIAQGKSASGVRWVVLAPDGSLMCVNTEGKQMACTASHLADLNSAVAAVPRPTGGIDGSGIRPGK